MLNLCSKLAIITLNGNVPNISIKKQMLPEQVMKQFNYILSIRNSKYNVTGMLKIKEQKMIHHANINQKKVGLLY